MTGKKHLFFLGLGAFAAILGFLGFPVINHQTSAQDLDISDKDYENGAKRFAAVKKKVTPGLKERFEEKELKWGSPIFIRA